MKAWAHVSALSYSSIGAFLREYPLSLLYPGEQSDHFSAHCLKWRLLHCPQRGQGMEPHPRFPLIWTGNRSYKRRPLSSVKWDSSLTLELSWGVNKETWGYGRHCGQVISPGSPGEERWMSLERKQMSLIWLEFKLLKRRISGSRRLKKLLRGAQHHASEQTLIQFPSWEHRLVFDSPGKLSEWHWAQWEMAPGQQAVVLLNTFALYCSLG